MKRMHEERKDIFSGIRKVVLTSPANIRNITVAQTMEKDKLEKSNYGQHSFDTGYRAVDLLKTANKPRNIVPATHGSSQVHVVPPLITNYINNSTHIISPTPISHNTLVKGSINPRPSFHAHVPLGIGTSVTSQRATGPQRLPSLKPTKNSTQIQLPIGNHVPGLPTVLTSAVVSRIASPNIATHGQSSDQRNDGRAALISDPHNHGLRGNTQALSQHSATIQVIASGTASLHTPQIPASFLTKGVNLGTSSGMLKINSTSQSNSISSNVSGSAFKLGIGKTYSGSSSIIIPATTSRSDHLDIRQTIVPSPYTRFQTALHPATTIIAANSATSSEARSLHQVGYHQINTAYVLHDMGIQSFSHQLVRPPSSSVPMFAIDRTLPTIPLVTIPAKDNSIVSSHANEPVRSEGLTIHGSLNIHTLYPSNFQPIFTTTSLLNTNETTVRPSILRKRPGESSVLYTADRNSSPVKKDLFQSSLPPAKIKSPPLLISQDKSATNISTSHSVVNITSEIKSTSVTLAVFTTTTTGIITAITGTASSKSQLLTNSVNHLIEASPKKKPRKQLIITTEDKYTPKRLINSNMTDDEEEFLKSNETMKDISPPKATVESVYPVNNMSYKNLFTLANSSSTEKKLKSDLIETSHFDNHRHTVNGIVSTLPSTISNDHHHPIYRHKTLSIIGDYKINTKAAYNHFYRASDMKVKEEKPSQERLVTKGAIEAASGWKLHYLTTQIDDLISIEDEISAEFANWKDKIRTPCSSPTSIHSTSLSGEDAQLRLIHELIQGNIQRCKCSMEQLVETKQNLFKALVHKNKAIDILNKYKPKARLKKKAS
ncbi:histone deacetylase complex subunit SAP130 [Hydra vulgaris]|uniref:Histone deacetylase complex subunit SAP130 n=1 Tax=Hydra vulgaris TaxID=6087 RepID=A0ABM4B837_HYDVU